jgi:hypothetical protein
MSVTPSTAVKPGILPNTIPKNTPKSISNITNGSENIDVNPTTKTSTDKPPFFI